MVAARACTARGAARPGSASSPRNASSSARRSGVVDLAREVLEEAVELLEVAVGHGQEVGGVGALGAPDRAQLDLQLVAEALDPARHLAPGRRARTGRARKSASRNARAGMAPRAVAQLDAPGRASRCARSGGPCACRRTRPSTSPPARSSATRRCAPRLPHVIVWVGRTGRVRWRRCRTSSGATGPTCAGPCWSAPSRAGTTPARQPPRPSRSSATSFDADEVARIDPEEFFDFTAVRPDRPAHRGPDARDRLAGEPVSAAPVPGAEGDLVMLHGVEPSLRWRRFCDNRGRARPASSTCAW